MAFSGGQLRELQGTLLPPKDPVEELDPEFPKEELEEEEDLEFVDAEELCSGGVKAGGLPGYRRAVIADKSTKETFKVFGRFPITGAWWQVKVQVKPAGLTYYQVQGFPSYFLQSDMSPPDQKHICSLFLKDCNFPSDNITKFLAWVNAVSSYKNLNFRNLTETLRTFQKEIERKNKKQSTQSEQEESLPDYERILPLESTIPFISAMTALQFPKIMEFLPILLPRHFKRIISSSSKEVLEDIEKILTTQPWKLGFGRITYRELKLLRCEASWTAFCQCKSLLQLMTDLEKNALMLYFRLKQLCREYGHTCVERDDLRSQLSEHMCFEDACQSLTFLKDIGVVVCEKACVFPYDLYQAEKGIASLICTLMTKPPWLLHVDVQKVLASIPTTKCEDTGSDDNTLNESKPDETKLENSVVVLETQDRCDHIWNNAENERDAKISEAQLDQDQVTALKMICSNAVTVISGKGGSGKTTIVSRLFKYIEQLEEKEIKKACEDFEQDRDVPEEWITFTQENLQKADKSIEVLLTAPTGKAAGLLRQRTGFSAYTLCQVNYSFYLWKKNMMTKDRPYQPWKFSSVRILVVDEGSLVSVQVFKSVLDLLCTHSKLSKLIILGDVRQLPSIEPGNLLEDVFETLKSKNCAVELRTNHRAESEIIVGNATRISRRQFPEFDAELNICDNPAVPVSIQDKTFIFVRLPEQCDSSQFSNNDFQSYLYSAVKTLLKGEDLQNPKTSQFIAFRRQDCDVINACCCKYYLDRLHKDCRNRLVFGTGDKICCTKNAYLSDILPGNTSSSQQDSKLDASGEALNGMPYSFAENKHDFESGLRLCNGEIFFITNDITFYDVTFGKKRFVTINNMAGLEVTVDFDKLMYHCHIKHAWARTIHTFQGSEEQTVVYVVGLAGRQHWQHVYTAVTRGRCRVYVIAQESQLRKSVRKQGIPRRTRLKHFLQDKLSVSCASPADFASSSKSSGDSGGPCSMQTLPLPLPAVIDVGVTDDTPRSAASVTGFRTPPSAEKWRLSSLDKMIPTEAPSVARGPKRTCGTGEDESPKKIPMVEESSPQVSSRLQNLRLNHLTPKQLFKPTNNQET
ncbi:PREDICTED: DNA helicase B [Condylura cristata]|uniref:DNA helicase B n=1 Tax=Condylura cristata TaxID=143302 RepID=UPI000334778A|nr:PREDICTED: DNA helicase B [Condylura cristata]